MPREFTRSDRVSDAIQRLLAQVIPQEVRDPRLGMVNINAVAVSRDMAFAKVYVTFVGVTDEPKSLEGIGILNKASGFLRSFVARELSMRTVPKLQFIYDKTSIRGQELSSLIDRAIAEDRLHPQGDQTDDQQEGRD
ncbi:30S ribosome-binding factor RbfA [Cellvibrio japonicus]|uniref:Ribosome-binding factor A n=1 Tax=Cellvibrio japonicus (strain Ueda107) TaxID=498211 RepID=RBFA_CELJU|nr:30S ribosome-binding factor RbfA [Cellvibrio japonicus]B3PI97.1 RecName: Full=Ribosome-binding factor A [Cellvibrio japonicus Ueda107]ACE83776.1 ribosome-binding factor A [Cellvibrio japonicus Ueda107]QEI11139.1 30S ribosome-binding factor RbfA [Cellvibrio japonicus]QEI14713.1 30S ribosome-binding factor RbfA [Cellvibrio japonicus]QEI18293.1 30S ribosome-binding factor RbfA [Cellvibrio japonicus]